MLALATGGMVGVTHNFFQDSPGGSSQGGCDFGLIPANVSATLDDAGGAPTWEAYVATGPDAWGVSDAHYCCTEWRQGCKTAMLMK